jgi:hypothetical protein
MYKSGKLWAVIFAIVIVLCAALYFYMTAEGGGRVAGIYSNGELVRVVDLDKLSEPCTFTVTYEGGTNTVYASSQGIYVESASCPDQTCVNHGELTGSQPIVCLPNRLVIKWIDGESEQSADAVSG